MPAQTNTISRQTIRTETEEENAWFWTICGGLAKAGDGICGFLENTCDHIISILGGLCKLALAITFLMMVLSPPSHGSPIHLLSLGLTIIFLGTNFGEAALQKRLLSDVVPIPATIGILLYFFPRIF